MPRKGKCTLRRCPRPRRIRAMRNTLRATPRVHLMCVLWGFWIVWNNKGNDVMEEKNGSSSTGNSFQSVASVGALKTILASASWNRTAVVWTENSRRWKICASVAASMSTATPQCMP